MKMTKKGISPLIATVLLLVLVVVIGAIIMTYVKTYTTESLEKTTKVTAKETTCAIDAKLNWVKIGDYIQVCRTNDSNEAWVKAKFTNDGEVALSGYKVRIITQQTAYQNSSTQQVPVGNAVTYDSHKGDATVGPIKVTDPILKIEIMPEIIAPGTNEKTICTNTKIEMDNILDCSVTGQ